MSGVRERPFAQVDVFGAAPFGGNPVAVVLDATGLDTGAMQRFAAWTNLSETTFVLPPDTEGADYRVRIFTASRELPFAGHPTLGTCHAWLEAHPDRAGGERFAQECAAGLVALRRTPDGLAFAAPALVRDGPVEPGVLARVLDGLGIAPEEVVAARWADNGPGWLAILLGSAERVLAVRPGSLDQDVGLVGPHPAGAPEAIEVRALTPTDGGPVEDPVTGSLNASVAEWLIGTGRLTAPYAARQGTALGRRGRVNVTQDEAGRVWVAGTTSTEVRGTVRL